MPTSHTSQNCDEAQNNIDSELELDKFAHVFEKCSAPFYGSVDRDKVVVEDDEVRIIFGDVAAWSHTKADICPLKRLRVGDALTRHSDQASQLVDPRHQNEFVFRRGSRQDFEPFLAFDEFFLILKFDFESLSFVVPDLVVVTDELLEFEACDGDILKFQQVFVDNSWLQSDILSCIDVVSTQDPNGNLPWVTALPKSKHFNWLRYIITELILHSESAQINELVFDFTPKLRWFVIKLVEELLDLINLQILIGER